jgi:hypothetical protein
LCPHQKRERNAAFSRGEVVLFAVVIVGRLLPEKEKKKKKQP